MVCIEGHCIILDLGDTHFNNLIFADLHLETVTDIRRDIRWELVLWHREDQLVVPLTIGLVCRNFKPPGLAGNHSLNTLIKPGDHLSGTDFKFQGFTLK